MSLFGIRAVSNEEEPPDSAKIEAWADWEVREAAAAFRAIPICTIVELLADGRVARLTCGHQKPLLVQLNIGDTVRCPRCFEAGMQAAERMVEGQ